MCSFRFCAFIKHIFAECSLCHERKPPEEQEPPASTAGTWRCLGEVTLRTAHEGHQDTPDAAPAFGSSRAATERQPLYHLAQAHLILKMKNTMQRGD